MKVNRSITLLLALAVTLAVPFEALSGPLPKSTQQMLKKLKVYGGDEHPHTAQKPKPLKIEDK